MEKNIQEKINNLKQINKKLESDNEELKLCKKKIENQIIEINRTSLGQNKIRKHMMIFIVSLSVVFGLSYSYLSFNQTKKMEKKAEIVEYLQEKDADDINKVINNISQNSINKTEIRMLSGIHIVIIMSIGGVLGGYINSRRNSKIVE